MCFPWRDQWRIGYLNGASPIEYPAKDRVALGADWRERCERPPGS